MPEGQDDLVKPGGDGAGGIKSDPVIEIGRKESLELGHHLFDTIDGFQGVRSGKLIERQDRRRLAVETALNVVVLGAQLEAGHVLQADQGAVRIGAQDDLAELFGGHQSALGPDGIGELLARREGLAADLSGRVHRILFLRASTISGMVILSLASHRASPSSASHTGRRRKP